MFGFLKRKNSVEQQGKALFERALAEAQKHGQQFFADRTPTDDTTLRQQRFEVIALFMVALLWRLKQADNLDKHAQSAYDTMFLSFDRSMREAGVGDIGIAHRIKKFAQAFHGRLQSYGAALDSKNESLLLDRFENNIKLPEGELNSIAKAAYSWALHLEAQPEADLLT